MNENKMVVVEKNTSHPIGDKVWETELITIIEWLAAHGYKAKKAVTMTNGKRICFFHKPGCKTEYTVYI